MFLELGGELVLFGFVSFRRKSQQTEMGEATHASPMDDSPKETPSHPEEIIDHADIDMANAVLLGQGAFGTV